MKTLNSKKIILTVLITVLVVISVIFIYASHQEPHEILYSNVSIDKAQKVIEVLKKENVSWKFDELTGTLSINSDDVGKIDKKSLDKMVQ